MYNNTNQLSISARKTTSLQRKETMKGEARAGISKKVTDKEMNAIREQTTSTQWG